MRRAAVPVDWENDPSTMAAVRNAPPVPPETVAFLATIFGPVREARLREEAAAAADVAIAAAPERSAAA